MSIIFLIKTNLNSNFIASHSKIHGIGIFSKNNINKNTILFEAIDENKKISYLGSLVNHCNVPNSKLIKIGNKYFLISIKNIKKGDEIIADYNDTPNFIKKPDPAWTC